MGSKYLVVVSSTGHMRKPGINVDDIVKSDLADGLRLDDLFLSCPPIMKHLFWSGFSELSK